MEASSKDVTLLLKQASSGSEHAANELVPLLYTELRRLAGHYMKRERGGHTLQATALVHEAYFKLVDQNVDWKNRSHFFAVAAQQMRRILVDYAKGHQAAKRGGSVDKLPLEQVAMLAPERGAKFLALEEALARLSTLDPRQAKVIELRFFGGLTLEEIAKFLEISVATVKREFSMAKAWLARELQKKNAAS